MHRIIQELFLVVILLLDVRVDVTILCLLILNKTEKTLVYSNLQLLMIICVLDHLVDGIFEVVNGRVIVPNDVSVCLDRLLDNALLLPQFFNHKAECSVDFVILPKFNVQGFSRGPQGANLNLLWSNVFSKISNLLI